MLCPRCNEGVMEERERHHVTVDVCPRCRGVFLDRGELERLIALAEPAEVRRLEEESHRRRAEHARDPSRALDDDRKHQRRRRGGFLDVLEDIFD
jgi:uncharacterized protein